MKFTENLLSQTLLASDFEIQNSESNVQLQNDSKIKRSSTKKTRRKQRWNLQENLLYIRFLKQNSQRLSKQNSRKFFKFQKMSLFIDSKSAEQCRTHHQKMLIRFKLIQNIIEGLLPKELSTSYFPVAKNKLQKMEVDIQQQPEVEPKVEQTPKFESPNIQEEVKINKNQLQDSFVCKVDENFFDVLF